MPLEYSTLVVGDLDEVLAFWGGMEGVGLNASDTPVALAGFIERNPQMSLLVRSGGGIVGAVLCGHDGRRGYLHHLAVAVSWQKRGIGRELVRRCVARLAAEGIQKCTVFVYADNADGARFWDVMGFRPREDLRVLQCLTGAP